MCMHVCTYMPFRARVDGLVKREETPIQMIETFKDREDLLLYKEINFSKPTKKFEPAETAYKRQIVVSAVCKYFAAS